MPANDSDRRLLERAAREAGVLAQSFGANDLDVRRKEADGSPVTAADLAVNDLLGSTLRGARPAYGWLSEESAEDPARHAAERVFIIDPIDGTRSFVEGSDTWAHSLAIAERGEVTAAVVYLPRRDLLYAAARGAGATLNGAAIRASAQTDIAEAEVLAARPVLAKHHWHGAAMPVFRRAYRPSLAYRMALVGEGAFDAMLTLRHSWEWDIAAGALIVTEAGGGATDRRGAPLRFNNADPRLDGVVAGGAHVHRALLDALA